MDKLRRRNDLSVEQVEDDLLILDKCNEKVHQLNRTAKAVWLRIELGSHLEDIVEDIAANFDVPSEVALQDVKRIIGEFRALGLLEDSADDSGR